MLRCFKLISLLGLAVVILFGSSVVPAFAQVVGDLQLVISETPMSVDELVDIALDNAGDYQTALESRDFNYYAMRGAWGSFLPSLSASAQYSNARSERESGVYYLNGVSIPSSTLVAKSSDSYVGLSASEQIFTGFQRWYGLKQAKLQLENGNLSVAQARNALIYNVKLQVYNVLSAQENLELAKEVVDLREETLRYARTRHETGEVIELDVMQAEIDLGNAKNDLLFADQNLENTREILNVAMGIDLSSRFPIDENLAPTLPALDPDVLIRYAERSNPEYKILANTVSIYKQDVKMQTSGYFPTVTLNGGYSRSESGEAYNKWILVPNDTYMNMSVNLSWNLFDRFQREIYRQQAVVNRRNAEWNERSRHLQIASDIRAKWRTLERLGDQIDVLERNRELARRQLELEQERYRLGASSQLNLRSSQVTFIQAETDYIQKVVTFQTTKAELENTLGVSLEEVQP